VFAYSLHKESDPVNLFQKSIEIMKAGQAASGAYVASPTFSQYGYSWLRDGTWIAYAMDQVGEHDSATAFHRWGANTILRYEDAIQSLLGKIERGEALDETDYLPTRFTLESELGQEEWPNFQLDGYGAWLWGLVDHVRNVKPDLWGEVRPAVALTVHYLEALWQFPNYDCWEEFRHEVHLSTLAALYGGLHAVQEHDPELVPDGLPESIQAFALQKGVSEAGHFQKYLGNDAVDASLLWLSVPFGLVPLENPHFQATLEKIETDLLTKQGGVYRYLEDVYFGGGEWLLLSAWLAWTYLCLGRADDARRLMEWVERQATATNELPEQVQHNLLHPHTYDGWVERWGEPANPLLWSHAMYLIVTQLMKESV